MPLYRYEVAFDLFVKTQAGPPRCIEEWAGKVLHSVFDRAWLDPSEDEDQVALVFVKHVRGESRSG